ncbi:hypothetical protein H9Q13_13985 [Pontibacter sp. JH31]|uniref:Uncharacterized protein n=1 Tax=Pontibacter aquaedesilientis TaxID=2766980 RepID=A0ABR7XLH9_9BACT|nr:hypothetical protein [Pontibacter aquaedesilientis]MBD1398276.1 hypothetical protein [Pontibacter aquaedesilientis]
MLYSGLAYGQLNNDALQMRMPVKPENANQVRIGLHAFGFSKNNEYFNRIADGYTLFGYHLLPRVSYYPAASVRIDAGAFLWKDFGSSGYQDIQPTFAVKVQRENWAFVFGTLESNLNHNYIEPLYDFERVINNRLENGMQFLLRTHRVDLDAWIDWSKMIYRADPDREEVAGGISSALQLLHRPGRVAGDSVRLSIPVQFTAQHKGGQIDNSDLPLLTVVNAAVGIALERQLPHKVLHRVYTKNYLLGFKDFSNTYQLPFKTGGGLYLNAGIDTKYQDVMLSYWRGSGYVTELGGKLFQSASTTYKNPDYVQEDRHLLILRLTKDVELLEDLYLSLRLEPVLDLDNPKLEFSNALYLTFDTDFFVGKPRK